MIGIGILLVLLSAIVAGIVTVAVTSLIFRAMKESETRKYLAVGLFSLMTSGLSSYLIMSVVLVGADEVGVVDVKFWPGWDRLPAGSLVARGNQIGLQAKLLEPGLHFVPALFKSVTLHPLVEIPQGTVGIVESIDGRPLLQGVEYSEYEWAAEGWYEPTSFLSSPHSCRGIQKPPLRPGKHRLHPALFRVINVDTTLRVVRFGRGESDVQETPKAGRLEEIQTSAQGTHLYANVRVNYRVTPSTAYKAISLLGPDFQEKLLDVVQSTTRSAVRATIQPLELFALMDEREKHEESIQTKMENVLTPYGVVLELVAFTSIYPPIDSADDGEGFRALLEARSKQELQKEEAEAQLQLEEAKAELSAMQLETLAGEYNVASEKIRQEAEIRLSEAKATADVESIRSAAEAEAAARIAEAESLAAKYLAESLGEAGACVVLAVREASENGVDLFPDVVLSNAGDEIVSYLLDKFAIKRSPLPTQGHLSPQSNTGLANQPLGNEK